MKTKPREAGDLHKLHDLKLDDRKLDDRKLDDKHESAFDVWGGAECTCNRVGDKYFDQLELTGHASRLADLDMFAELGLSALRTGLLWERHVADPSWNWEDAYMGRLRSLGVKPIVGLLHHGSGPRSTSLLDPDFSEKLAEYARSVAERYPWVSAYTPVNEPQTTARFACHYGIWYPHRLSPQAFVQALLNQMRGVVLSMQAIRQVRPDAQLVQTDDLGKVYSTPELSAVCATMNERRWLPFDLLCGAVDRHHPLFSSLLGAGASEGQILWFRDHPCPADVIGVNYYVTSDRYLDQRLDLFPSSFRSAEGAFVDIEAVRIHPAGIQTFEAILVDAWKRYGRPVAITELHLGDGVDQQLRWASQAWAGALAARRAGADVRAVTFWALLGSCFWNELVTAANGHYEPGVFTLTNGVVRPTQLATLVRECAQGLPLGQDTLRTPGWWQMPERLVYSAPFSVSPSASPELLFA